MIQRGNEKLGRKVFTVSTLAGPDATCPGASEYCAAACYAARISRRRPNVAKSWGANTDLLRADLAAYVAVLAADLDKRKAGDVVRIHVSGDFMSQPHIDSWADLAARYPHVTFYAYTRSWAVGLNFARLRALANVRVWASHDATMIDAPDGWNVAGLFETAEDCTAAGYVQCPEQTGRKDSCSDCGLCWKSRIRPGLNSGSWNTREGWYETLDGRLRA